ncbi:MAG: DUF3237 domain-containing protein [Panacagrimonas sp.]
MSEPTLETRWLATLRGSIPQPEVISPQLMIFNVLDAKFESPRLSATVANPSGDWVRVMPNSNWKLDVRLLLKADDGSPIYTHYNGVLKMTPQLGERIAAGEEVPGEEIYFRSAPYFETPSEKYGWLNDILAIGKIRSFGGGKVVYDVFEVL